MWKSLLLMTITAASLQAEIKVLAFAGSTRDDSFNLKLVKEAAHLAEQKGARVTVVNLKDYPIPFYESDLETKEGMPANAKALRQLFIQNDVIFIASPEYNGSLSALLKNILDWASRSESATSSRDAFKGKKFVLFSTSPGQGGGARGLVHLKTIIENIGGTVLANQMVVPNAYNAFNEQGQLKNPEEQASLSKLVSEALNNK